MDIPETRKITIFRGGTDHTIELDEAESSMLLGAILNAWGWQGTMFSRGDFSTVLEREITDSEWAEIQGDYTWYEGLPDHLTEVGWDIIRGIIAELELDRVKQPT